MGGNGRKGCFDTQLFTIISLSRYAVTSLQYGFDSDQDEACQEPDACFSMLALVAVDEPHESSKDRANAKTFVRSIVYFDACFRIDAPIALVCFRRNVFPRS
ncbi:hypothetical protein BAUCODRAFT_29367 [Baudoinia panamericana UAMH 10762]|uniref:Uncharacterized protein n=1 Tax=Baudoinia panamericana (strain UAMH 10762) TaxID=717646 RepID=M2NP14_BAUPA|nr:uncharacterized protein BAUCODRAFT_29367 [Baudoinia panamericana UAMH 10762]EMD00981.1 hypothetical protein BAUCODRAFT_29367 [Baudoinia panamericana UAMH 10762]